MPFCKTIVRTAVIGALVVGAGIVVAQTPRGRACFMQARKHINAKIDSNITDPVALRVQLRDLEAQYPQRIADVRGDLAELQEQLAQLKREQAVNERVVALADTDLEKLQSALTQAEETSIKQVALEVPHRIVIVFRGDRLEVDQAYNKVTEITNTRNAYASRTGDIDRDLGYLAQQEERLTALLNKLETERQTFQAQLWDLDRQVDAVARNDRMIEIMQKRQHTIDEQSRYRAASLDQITARLADIKAKQEAKLAGITAETDRTSYEDAAKADLDRELGARRVKESRMAPVKVQPKPTVIEIRPDDSKKSPAATEEGPLASRPTH